MSQVSDFEILLKPTWLVCIYTQMAVTPPTTNNTSPAHDSTI